MIYLNHDVWEMILRLLSNRFIWILLNTNTRLKNILRDCTSVFRNRTLEINSENVAFYHQNLKFDDIPFRNVKVNGIDLDNRNRNSRKVFGILFAMRFTIKTLKIQDSNIESASEFINLCNEFRILESLELEFCNIRGLHGQYLREKQTLNSIKLVECNSECFKFFGFQNYIQSITVERFLASQNDLNWVSNFAMMMRRSPNATELIMNAPETSKFLEEIVTPSRLTTLKVFSLNSTNQQNEHNIWLFLVLAVKTLRSLHLKTIPYNVFGREVLAFILDSFNLKTFQLGPVKLIANGSKQLVKELQAEWNQIYGATYLLSRFAILTFTFKIPTDRIYSTSLSQLFSMTPKNLDNVQQLNIIDEAGENFYQFTDFFKKFINIKALSIKSNSSGLSEKLSEFLYFMRHLQRIFLEVKSNEIWSVLQTIKEKVRHLSVLFVPQEYLNLATEVFSNRIDVSVKPFDNTL